MKIVFIMTDESGYKTFLELKNYLYNYYDNYNEINITYHYINANINDIIFNCDSFVNIESHLLKAFSGEDEILSKYYYNYYNIKKPYGYAIARTMFIPSSLIVLKNFLNNNKYLLDNINTGEYLTTIKYNKYNDYIEFESQYDNIPEADLYILSERNGACDSALLTIQLSVMLYLYRKYNHSKIIIGGGRNNTKNNPIVNLINAIGENYTNNKIEYCVGDIGAVICNYIINNENYNYSYGMNKKKVLNLNITEYEMNNILKNNFGISFSKGCVNNCPFCIGHNSSLFDIIYDFSIYEQYFIYLNKNYPNTNINIFDNEINHTKGYFSKFIDYILTLNINNPITIFLDLNMITNEDIKLMKQYKNLIVNISADYIDINNKKDIVSDFETKYKNLIDNNINVDKIYIVGNIPTFKTINNNDFIKIFNLSYDKNIFEDFRLEFSSDMYINSKQYDISFYNYKNKDNIFKKIEKELNNISIIYYRKDYNRKELLNEKYKLLNKLKGYLMLINSNNLYPNNLINSLVSNIYINSDLIDNKIDKLDNMIDEYIKQTITKNK